MIRAIRTANPDGSDPKFLPVCLTVCTSLPGVAGVADGAVAVPDAPGRQPTSTDAPTALSSLSISRRVRR